MPLSKAQTENFVGDFFKDHRLPAPPIGYRRAPAVDPGRARKRLNLTRPITRRILADQLAARLCRDCGRRLGHRRFAPHFEEWRKYTREIVLHHFGPGDGL